MWYMSTGDIQNLDFSDIKYIIKKLTRLWKAESRRKQQGTISNFYSFSRD